jgi:myosin heavy subunit
MRHWKGKASMSGIGKEAIQIGKSKIFLRKPPHDLLEGRRSRITHVAALKIQAVIQGYTTRLWFRKVKKACRKIQKNARATNLRKTIKRRIQVTKLKKEEALLRQKEAQRKAELEMQKSQIDKQKALLKGSLNEMIKKKSSTGKPEEETKVKEIEKEIEKFEEEKKKAEEELMQQLKQADNITSQLEKLQTNKPFKRYSVTNVLKSVVLGPKYLRKKKGGDGDQEIGDSEMVQDGDVPEDNTTISRLFTKNANADDKDAYKKQFPKLYSKSRVLNMFSSARPNAEDEDESTTTSSGAAASEKPPSQLKSLKQRIFGKKAVAEKPKMAKRMKFAEEQYLNELKMYLKA